MAATGKNFNPNYTSGQIARLHQTTGATGTVMVHVTSGSTAIFPDYETVISYYCRYCGGAIRHPYYPNARNQMCDKCEKEIFSEFWAEKIPKTSEYCQDCKSHIKACQCPKKKALDSLRQ